MKFFKLEVSEVTVETQDAISVYFMLNDAQKLLFKYKSGQYLIKSLRGLIDTWRNQNDSERRLTMLS